MTTHTEQRAYDLRCEADAIEAVRETVTVELSLAAAWLLRDSIGLAHIPRSGQISLIDDMLRLNDALGYRPVGANGSLPEPHVSGWSAAQIKSVTR